MKGFEEEILKAYHAYWDAYFAGDMESFASYLDDDCHIIGSTAHDTFDNKKEALTFYTATANEVAGKGEYRNRKITVLPQEENAMVQEICDYYFRSNNEWHLYGTARISTLLSKKTGSWKIIHQHGSLPDARADEGQQLGTESVTKENLQLKEAIKRNTTELRQQNKKLELENSLEKVRSVAMAMLQPDDLLSICEVMFTELLKLGFDDLRNTMINIHYDDQAYLLNYDYAIRTGKTITRFKYHSHPIVDHIVNHARHSKEEFTQMIYSGDALDELRDFRKQNGEEDDARLDEVNALCYYFYATGIGALGVSMYQPANEEQLNILKRFRNVFDLAYKRYTDISHAEAQAREAQVEAALEKVRSRSLAMHKSDELQEVVNAVFERLQSLNIEMNVASIFIFKEGTKDWQQWVASSDTHYSTYFHIPYTENVIFRDLEEARKNHKDFYAVRYSFEEKNDWFNYAFAHTEYNRIPDARKKFLLESPFYEVSFALAKNTGIQLAKYSGNDFTDSDKEILKRFSHVFEQAYTRFLDLQKAEAQARETEIQLALERVRARTMAMYKSIELAEVAVLLFEQIKHLGVKSFSSGFNIWDNEHKNLISWMSNATGKINPPFELPIQDYDQHQRIFNAWEKKISFLEDDIKGPALTKHYNFLRSFPLLDESFKQAEQAGIKIPDRQVHNIAFFSNGYLLFITQELTPQYHSIFQRFARVFDQTYTRFLDLQKAEAQAREAEIELGLERVRARAMSMQSSDELGDLVAVLFEELTKLHLILARCIIWIFDKDSLDTRMWMANKEEKGSARSYHIKYLDHPYYNAILKGWREKQPNWVYDLKGPDKKSIDTYLLEETELSQLPHVVKQGILNTEEVFVAGSFNNFGLIEASGPLRPSEENLDILNRFGKVFDLSYTRFNDLKNAEAQAREAQIQLALERVRARTMAMQTSDELAKAALVLFEQVKSLGFASGSCGFNIWQQDEEAATVWASSPEGGLQPPFTLPHTESEVYKSVLKARQRGEDYLIKDISGESLVKHFDFLITLPGIGPIIQKFRDTNYVFPERIIFHFAFFKQGYLSFHEHQYDPEATDIFKRFAKVFEQTYTRFLDLQKAEAQAKEAQIEAALEKVRSRSIGMQKSEELKEVIQVLFDQFIHLHINVDHAGFVVDYQPKADWNFWIADKNEIPAKITHPYFDSEWARQFEEAKEKGHDSFITHLNFEEKNKFYEELLSYVPGLSAASRNFYMDCPGLAATTVVFNDISLYIENFNGIPYSNEENKILQRFGKVFQQTYTRFLDLQKSEAQARESQIQLALERVRSRTMAMQHSDEMAEAAALLFEQVSNLGINSWTSGFNIWQYNDTSFIGYNPSPTGGITPPYIIPSTEDAFFKKIYDAKQQGIESLMFDWGGEALAATYDYMKTLPVISSVLKDFEASGISLPTYQINHCMFFTHGFLLFITLESYPEAHDIFKRFAKEFGQTYTRFLDLQKAEAQARESQIDAALEKVRSRTMAMQKSEEIMDVVTTIVEKVGELNIEMDGGVSLATLVEDSKDLIHWYVNPDHLDEPRRMHLPYFPCKVYDDFNEARENKQELLSVVYDKEEKNRYFQTAFEISEFAIIPDELKKWILEQDYFGYTVAIQNHAVIFFNDYSGKKFTAAENDILLRFSKVFEHAYTRFIDLQKAEAQARESQIQLALERVRARTMAMQKSAELPEAANLLFQQIKALGMPTWSAGYNILSSDKTSSLCIMSSEGETQIPFTLPLTEHQSFIPWHEAILRNDDLFVDELGGEDLVDHYSYLKSLPELRPVFQQFDDAGISLPTFQINHLARFNQGFLLFITYEPVPESHEIFKRFAKVFEQTYTRFLDLQKAEAQAREAQIEAALEKVRSRSLAMHKTDELKEVVLVIVEKLQELGVVLDANGVILCTYFNNSRDVLHWIASPDFSFAGSYLLPYFEHPIFSQAWESKEKGDEYFSKAFSVEEKNSFFEYAFEHSDYKYFPEEFKQWVFQNDQHILSFAWQENSAILIPSHTGVVPTADEVEILKRFARVFEQAYIRFMDLQKAEAQAREAQIESALEKVRSRTMGMQRSEELGEVAAILFHQLTELGIQHTGCGFVIYNADKPMGDMWFSYRGDVFPQSFPIAFDASPVLAPVYQAWKNREVFYKVFMKGEVLANHLDFLKRQFGSRVEEVLSQMKERLLEEGKEMPDQMIMHHTYFSKGSLILNNFNDITDQPILNRFAQVFEQTYTRFLDIQNAEAQAREAQIEGALEKVRSRTLAMQHSNELAETAAVLFQQLIQLGITPNRLYIAIVKDETGATEFWITDEDGTKISTAYTANLNDNMSFEKMLAGWQQQEKSLVIDMQGEELQRYFRHLTSLGTPFKDGLDQKRRVQYIAYFGKGFIGMASPDEQPPETLNLLERFAYVFNLTFTRFNDLQIAEAHAKKAEQDLIEIKEARKNAETALAELQATQKQLIQSEKMASLGELTAGIAHEIQNPLNFVNNFSEVSNELLDEIMEDMEKGNYEEVKLIVEDIKQNLTKINHHGKRADGIVKGMLQHSRTSTGQKEQTDINILCDEYLRLAYHGLRAKDKTFNAELTTNFDDSIGKLSIVPQEIGRVLLNLVNNAFYAVKEKSKENIAGYQPTVTVTTKKLEDKIEISVKDNGNGIPDHIKEKIFQPFFTTKPTGQGTGLGLSLSYDIVKAHGGELTAKTKEKEGTEFVLQLPVA